MSNFLTQKRIARASFSCVLYFCSVLDKALETNATVFLLFGTPATAKFDGSVVRIIGNLGLKFTRTLSEVTSSLTVSYAI